MMLEGDPSVRRKSLVCRRTVGLATLALFIIGVIYVRFEEVRHEAAWLETNDMSTSHMSDWLYEETPKNIPGEGSEYFLEERESEYFLVKKLEHGPKEKSENFLEKEPENFFDEYFPDDFSEKEREDFPQEVSENILEEQSKKFRNFIGEESENFFEEQRRSRNFLEESSSDFFEEELENILEERRRSRKLLGERTHPPLPQDVRDALPKRRTAIPPGGGGGGKKQQKRPEMEILETFNKAPLRVLDLDTVSEPGRIWIPISIERFNKDTQNPLFKMCQLRYDVYAAEPWTLPMGGLLNQISGCQDIKSDFVQLISEADLELALAASKAPVMKPNGFIYHETRCGSTLVSNMLASVPANRVWSESTGPWKVLHTCKDCPKDQIVRYLRLVMSVMGRATGPVNRLFFKFQNSESIEAYSAAFPETKWMFLFRDPVEVLMSRLGAQRVGMDGQKDEVEERLENLRRGREGEAERRKKAANGNKERGLAKQLANLCKVAIDASEAYPGNGVMVDYLQLPDSLIDFVFPHHFGLNISEEEKNILVGASTQYSKAVIEVAERSKHEDDKVFVEDSEAKHNAANEIVKTVSNEILMPIYMRLVTMQTWLDDPWVKTQQR